MRSFGKSAGAYRYPNWIREPMPQKQDQFRRSTSGNKCGVGIDNLQFEGIV
jgi:hypothetical protein